MKYKLTITERAEELLDHILYYIINQLNNPQAAGNLIDEIEHVYGNRIYQLQKSQNLRCRADNK